MPERKVPLVKGEVYHIFNKSIAGFRIFNNNSEFSTMIDTIRYYQYGNLPVKFSFWQRNREKYGGKIDLLGKDKLVNIIAYCIMPTHIHLILKQLKENGISIFMRKVLNSYTHYFNMRHKRRGPLWEGRFENVLVETDEQLLHLTRYIHLNPCTAFLVDNPEDWLASSYKEFLSKVDGSEKICKYNDMFEVNPESYKKFVLDLVSYQRELAKIKSLLLE